MTDSPESTTVLAVLKAKDLKEARKIVTSPTTIPIEGLAYYPSARKSKILDTYLRQAGLAASPDLRVVDLGRKPGNLFAALSLLFVGTAVLLWIAVRVLRHGEGSSHGSKKTRSQMGVHTFAEMKKTPIPEETRMEVSHMLGDVWDRIQAR